MGVEVGKMTEIEHNGKEVCDCKTHLYIGKFLVRNSNLLFWYCSILTM